MKKAREETNLWTIHPKDFLITEGYVDHAKSQYYQESGVKQAYHKLWDYLSIQSGQVVWCYTYEYNIAKTGIKKSNGSFVFRNQKFYGSLMT